MVYDKVEQFILKQTLSEIKYELLFKEKLHSLELSEKGLFCRGLFLLCKNLYSDKFFNPKPLLERLDVIRLTDKWFFIRKSFGKGLFCNANAIFPDVYCEQKECHRSAFDFVLTRGDSRIKNCCLKSGTIDPYDILPSGIMHSICEFEIFGKNFVFDGANFLIMQKELYYNLFNFKEKQTITRDKLLVDLQTIANKRNEKEIIKETSYQYSLLSSSKLKNHFAEFGFIRYLYDRDSSMKQNRELKQRNKILMKKIVKIQSENLDVESLELKATKVPNMRHLTNDEVNI